MIRLHDGTQGEDIEIPIRNLVTYDPGDGRGEIRLALAAGDGHAVALQLTPQGHDLHWGEDGKPRPLAGYALDRETADRLARGILGAAPTRTVLPPQVVMWDGLRLAWWTPAARRPIFFAGKEKPELRHVTGKHVPWPPLLFVADPGRVHLFALRENERPEANSELCQAPLLNVYPDGWCCEGSVQWPRTLSVDTLGEWEQALFRSEGAVVWAARLTLYPGGHDALWSAMLTTERFPVETLVPTGRTLLDAINREGLPEGIADRQPREVIVPVVTALGDAA